MMNTLGHDAKWYGNEVKMVMIKNKETGVYENVYELYDHGKLIGRFSRDTHAFHWWIKVYIPSKRTKTVLPYKWD